MLGRSSETVAKVCATRDSYVDFDVMDALVVDNPNRWAGTRYVTKFDAIPGFWNYLVGLDRDDLIAELVQNDLDQGATRTVISFEKDVSNLRRER